MSVRCYARDGSEITTEQWVKLLADKEYRQVASTRIGRLLVSTVWLGLEHHFSFGTEEPDFPIHTFETMIFGLNRDEDYMWRYGTEAAALDGHNHAVALARIEHQLDLPYAEVERPEPARVLPSLDFVKPHGHDGEHHPTRLDPPEEAP